MTIFSKFHLLVLAGVFAVVPSLCAQTPAHLKIFPLSEVHRGLKGTAFTVFEGVEPESMEVEILGVLKDNLGPGQDMILARLHGAKAEFTGVVAGMSGSPVYIDGRLLGALSYRIGQFSKEPIAGITPIEQMFEVRDAGALPGAGSKAPITANGPQLQPMETPLVFTGFTQEAVDRFGDRFRALGMVPVAGLGGLDPEAKQPEPLVPGSAVSAVLVRGDIAMTGTCTVTYVDATQLLACGHPITQYGAVSIPMTKANVVATLPSPLNAFKIVNATETVGAFTQDRASAIYGRFGLAAHMIPVTVEIAGAGPAIRARTIHFEVLDNRQLTPNAMLVSVYQSLQGTNNSASEISYRLTGEMRVSTAKGEALPPLQLDAEMAQNDFNPAAINAALYVGERFDKVYQNSVEQPVIMGLRLHVEAVPTRRTAVIETARLSAPEARPGDTVEVETTLRPYQSASRLVRLQVRIPAGTAPGPVRLMVSDGATLDRLLLPAASAQHPLALADTIAQINRSHANDRLYLTMLEHAPQAVLTGGTLSAVPLSMANVLEPLKEGQEMRLTGESAVESSSIEVPEAITGSKVLTLIVR
ncbi:SpoIVB peptidase S55 domain-containing protein [Granulicella pectinivorans]|uniref:SpoIVB peptidase S55 domain-containing protein n=1 Tax=Granulicella pectinivorans TaxID=474950 RepID=UPI001FE5EE84|nr:SpoIVB peptidase S55 domain-containing protein [Granulicella pectinivorans]